MEEGKGKVTLDEQEVVVNNNKGVTAKCPVAEGNIFTEVTGKIKSARRLANMILVNFEEFENFYVNATVIYVEKEGGWHSLIEG